MNAPIEPHRFLLEPFEARRFANLCGQFDEHLRLIEQRLTIEIRNRGNQFELIGDPKITSSAENLLRRLYREARDKGGLGSDNILDALSKKGGRHE